jgi:hypothetical protein
MKKNNSHNCYCQIVAQEVYADDEMILGPSKRGMGLINGWGAKNQCLIKKGLQRKILKIITTIA